MTETIVDMPAPDQETLKRLIVDTLKANGGRADESDIEKTVDFYEELVYHAALLHLWETGQITIAYVAVEKDIALQAVDS